MGMLSFQCLYTCNTSNENKIIDHFKWENKRKIYCPFKKKKYHKKTNLQKEIPIRMTRKVQNEGNIV